jgi:hypothetical protein
MVLVYSSSRDRPKSLADKFAASWRIAVVKKVVRDWETFLIAPLDATVWLYIMRTSSAAAGVSGGCGGGGKREKLSEIA